MFTEDQWNRLTDDQRREAFRKKNILIKGSSNAPRTSDEVDPFLLKELAKFVDPYAQLQALGKSSPSSHTSDLLDVL